MKTPPALNTDGVFCCKREIFVVNYNHKSLRGDCMEKFISFFTTLTLIFNYLFGLGAVGVSDGWELSSKQKLSPVVSMFSGQGICCDGEHFYGSGSMTAVNFTGLARFDLNMKCELKKSGRVPEEFHEKYGSDHIGGIDCANGFIYAPVEGDTDEGYLYNFILLYDCETLEYTGTYYDMTGDYLNDGIPWCAVDRENGFLYTSRFDPVDEILQYDLETMQFIKAIPLEKQLHRIQGGSVYEGNLYLSFDNKNPATEEYIYCVNPEDGSVETVLVRTLPNYDNEAEDLCVYPLPDGTLIHTLDYDKFICTNILHLKKTGE